MFSIVLAPAFFPRNFRLVQALDSTTVQFAWDLPTQNDEPQYSWFSQSLSGDLPDNLHV